MLDTLFTPVRALLITRQFHVPNEAVEQQIIAQNSIPLGVPFQFEIHTGKRASS